jgi:uncharacterized protein YkwD
MKQTTRKKIKRSSRQKNKTLTTVFSLRAGGRIKKIQSSFHQGAWIVAALFVLTGLPNLVSAKTHTFGVLAYATEMSQQGLLDATNQKRSANGVGDLSLNSKLNSAAQSKANDMATRNYWSHNTPEGNPPWVFFNAAGYQYKKAGENLAYGFTTSTDTIVGWMNSPPHKANLLDTAFSEVGFGFANNANYQSNGEETIVVAMYGQPYSSPVPSPAPTPASPAVKSATQTAPPPAPTPLPSPTPAPTPTPTPTAPTPSNTDVVQAPKNETQTAYNSDASTKKEPAQKATSRIQLITKGKAAWSTAAVGIAFIIAAALWVSKHLLVIRRMLKHGEKFVIHHPALDIALLTFIVFAYLAIQSTGFIK